MITEHTVNPKIYEWCDEHNVWWVDCLECYRDELTMKVAIEAAIRQTKIDDRR
jgi:hypothetical protein